MKPTTDDNLEDRLGELPDLFSTIETITEAIKCAETVETPADFDANIEEAIRACLVLLGELKAVRS